MHDSPHGNRTPDGPVQDRSRRAVLRTLAGVSAGVAIGVAGPAIDLAHAAPVQAPELPDEELLSFAASVALAVAELLDDHLRARVEAALQAPLAMFAQQHRDHAASFADVVGVEVTSQSVVLAEYLPQLGSTQIPGDAALIAQELVRRTGATYIHLLGRLQSVDTAAALARALPTVSAQVAVIGSVLGQRLAQIFPAGGMLATAVGGLGSQDLGFAPERYRESPLPEVTP